MKSLITILAVIALLSLNLSAQTGGSTPTEVTKAFSQKFPKATEVKWGKECSKEWEAEFKMDGKEYSANFDNSGKWMETERKICPSTLPKAIKKTIMQDFLGYKVVEAEATVSAKGKAYEVEFANCKHWISATFDNNGKALHKNKWAIKHCDKSKMKSECKEAKENCKENKECKEVKAECKEAKAECKEAKAECKEAKAECKEAKAECKETKAKCHDKKECKEKPACCKDSKAKK
jgi:hypothetical protein